MIQNIKIFLLCPIPEDQKPINEYIALKENPLFNWITLEIKKYKMRLFSFYILICFFIAINQGNLWKKNIFEVLFSSLSIGSGCIVVYLIVVFIRWKDIKKRFNQARLFYEEASWFDGQIWEKPFFLIKNDKLISTQKIEGILKRLIREIYSFISLMIFFWICFEFS